MEQIITIKRRSPSPELKTKVALEGLKGDNTVAELDQRYNLISTWIKELLENITIIFTSESQSGKDRSAEMR